MRDQLCISFAHGPCKTSTLCGQQVCTTAHLESKRVPEAGSAR